MKNSLLALVALVLACVGAQAHAQYVFCKFEGQVQGIIRAGNTIKGQEDTIAVLSLASGLSTPFDLGSGLPTGRRVHEPLTIVKNLDKASPLLFLVAIQNENLKQVDCVFYRTEVNGAGVLTPYFRVKLQNARIVENDVSGSAQVNAGMRETIRIAYERILVEALPNGPSAEDEWSSRL